MSTVYSQTKRVENLHLTRERDRRRGRELATFLLVGLPVACAFLAYAALHIETVRVGYMREARQRTLAELNEESRRLRADLGQASSPERVAEVARREGLRPPHPGQVQIVAGTDPSPMVGGKEPVAK